MATTIYSRPSPFAQLRTNVLSLLIAVGVVAGCWFWAAPAATAVRTWISPPPLAMSAVKLTAPFWTGSGVYLGDGFIITAGHVTDGLKNISVLMSDGKKATGEVLWTNTLDGGGYDVSLVYAKGLPAASAKLSCRPTKVGDHVSIVGNPNILTFLETWGRVSGAVSPLGWGDWKSLVALDIVAAPGVSGGPVYNDSGGVVGILVSGLVDQHGTYGYSFMVPSTTICMMLGRT